MIGAIFIFKYHHSRCYILHNALKYIDVLEISDGFSEQLDQVKTKCNNEDCMMSTLMKQSLMMFKNVNLYKSSSNSHQKLSFIILFFKLFFLDYNLILKIPLL